MNFLEYDLDLDGDDVIEVTLDNQANVRLMDSANFQKYKSGASHRYYGGLATRSPARIRAPQAGRWKLTIDLGGRAGRVKASVRTLRRAVTGTPGAPANAT